MSKMQVFIILLISALCTVQLNASPIEKTHHIRNKRTLDTACLDNRDQNFVETDFEHAVYIYIKKI